MCSGAVKSPGSFVDFGTIIFCLFANLTFLITAFLTYLLPYLSTSSRIGPFRFQTGGRRKRPNPALVFSKRELTFTLNTFAIDYAIARPSVVCLSPVVNKVRAPSAGWNFGNVSMPFGTLAICWHSLKIFRRSSQGNPTVGSLNERWV